MLTFSLEFAGFAQPARHWRGVRAKLITSQGDLRPAPPRKLTAHSAWEHNLEQLVPTASPQLIQFAVENQMCFQQSSPQSTGLRRARQSSGTHPNCDVNLWEFSLWASLSVLKEKDSQLIQHQGLEGAWFIDLGFLGVAP